MVANSYKKNSGFLNQKFDSHQSGKKMTDWGGSNQIIFHVIWRMSRAFHTKKRKQKNTDIGLPASLGHSNVLGPPCKQ